MPDFKDVKADLTSYHIEGIAIHGNVPFSCPLITEIDDTLWQGGYEDGVSLQGYFKHIFSLYPWGRFYPGGDLDSLVEVRLYDGKVIPDEEQLFALARWINVCRKHGRTLVHCQAGLNRSGLLTALALIMDGMTPVEAIEKLRASRSPVVLCNKAFETWLLQQGGL